MSVTCDVSQLERSPSKAVAFENIDDISVTCDVSHVEIAWLNCNLSRKSPTMLVTLPVAQFGMSTHPEMRHLRYAGSWSKHISSEEQHSSPDGTASRHASTSAFNCA